MTKITTDNEQSQPSSHSKKIQSTDRKRVSGSGMSTDSVSKSNSKRAANSKRTMTSGRTSNSKKTSDSKRSHNPKKNAAKYSSKRNQRKHTTVRGNLLEEISEMLKRETTFRRSLRLLFAPLAILWFEIIFRIFCGESIFRGFLGLLVFSFSLGYLLTAITSLFPKEINRILNVVLLMIFALWFDIEATIYDSFNVFMTIRSLITGAGGVAENYTGNLLRAILFALPKYVIFCLPVIIYIIFGKRFISAQRRKPKFAVGMFVTAMVLHLMALMIIGVGGNWSKYKGNYRFDTATSTFGLMTSTRLSAKYAITGGGSAVSSDFESEINTNEESVNDTEATSETSDASNTETASASTITGQNVMDIDFASLTSDDETISSLNQYVASQTASNKNAYTGLFKGKNLIMICAEAFSDCVIDENLTPTLYRLVHNGFYFSEYYQPTWGGSTSTGEYSMVTGLAPLDEVDTMLETEGKNMYFTMGNQMQRLGYFSEAFHDGEYDYYSRNETHQNLGYTTFLGLGNGLEDITGNWPGDDIMFDKTMDTYLANQPFSIYYMSISGHCTYVESDEKVERYYDQVKAYYGDRYQDTTLYYICYQMELEDALTTMISKLEAAGIADDTVICMTADHYPYGLEESDTFGNDMDYVSDLYGYTYTNGWEQDHNTCIIWSECLENEYKNMACEVSGPTYSLDILPTLSNLFGVEYDSRLLPGRDVFADNQDPLVLWINGSWATVQGKYDANTETFYPNDGYTEDQNYIDQINTIVSNKIKYSGKALDSNYWGYLFGEDPETGNNPAN